MNKRYTNGSLEGKRMFSVIEAQEYCGLGRAQTRKIAEEAGAVKRYGRRVLIDRVIFDRALDQMGQGA